MQSTTPQNDLIEAFFVVSTTFFVVRGLRDRSHGDMTIAALALAMAVGTKGTAFVAGTALVVLAGAMLMAYRPPVRFVGFAAAQMALAMFELGVYQFVLNLQHRGGVFGGLQSATAVDGCALPERPPSPCELRRLARCGRSPVPYSSSSSPSRRRSPSTSGSDDC